jgi:hypothetical protein
MSDFNSGRSRTDYYKKDRQNNFERGAAEYSASPGTTTDPAAQSGAQGFECAVDADAQAAFPGTCLSFLVVLLCGTRAGI